MKVERERKGRWECQFQESAWERVKITAACSVLARAHALNDADKQNYLSKFVTEIPEIDLGKQIPYGGHISADSVVDGLGGGREGRMKKGERSMQEGRGGGAGRKRG